MEENNENIFLTKSKCIKISDYKPNALPLTLISFRGEDIISKTIRIIEKIQTGNGEFSHCGILITSDLCPFIPNLKPNKLYIWESTILNNEISDITTNKQRFGVQIRDLDELLPKYLEDNKSAIAYCNLLNNPWVKKDKENMIDTADRRENIINIMKMLYKKYHDKIYEMNCLQLLSTVLPCLRKPQRKLYEKVVDGVNHIYSTGLNGKEDDFVFCSEFITIIYKALDIIDSKFVPSEVTPTDFFGNDIDGIPKIVEDPVYLEL